MTQEEKAKAYDEAIKKMKSKLKDFKEIIISRSDIEEIFPELKESEDERIRKTLINMFKGYNIQKVEDFTDKEIIAWLEKQGDQKSACNEEDERIIKRIDLLLYSINERYFEDIHAWLKSLKNRLQPKQECSEEANNKINSIKYLLHELGNHNFDNWLESLRAQSTWKPSDKQMNALDSTLQYSQVSYNSFEHLNSLFNDLKKLREE